MCMHTFIKIQFKTSIGPFSLFQNLELGKASTAGKCHFPISWASSYQYQFVGKSLSKCSKWFISYRHFSRKVRGHFQNLELGKASTNDKCHFAISWARSCHYHHLYKLSWMHRFRSNQFQSINTFIVDAPVCYLDRFTNKYSNVNTSLRY